MLRRARLVLTLRDQEARNRVFGLLLSRKIDHVIPVIPASVDDDAEMLEPPSICLVYLAADGVGTAG